MTRVVNEDGVRKVIIEDEEPQECKFCGAFEETRPYGPNGEQVCFECGMKNEETTRKQFTKRLLGIKGPLH
jgi:hypothetical protein